MSDYAKRMRANYERLQASEAATDRQELREVAQGIVDRIKATAQRTGIDYDVLLSTCIGLYPSNKEGGANG